MRSKGITEKQFQSQVVRIAKVFGWMAYHTYDSRRSEPGFPDLVLVRERVMFRELKTEKGRLTPAQKLWGERLKSAGSDYDIWRPSMKYKIQDDLRCTISSLLLLIASAHQNPKL